MLLSKTKKEKEEALERAKADLAAGKVPPFQISGTPKSPPPNPPAAQCLGERAPPPPSYDPSKKRSADERVACTKRHRSEDPVTGVRRTCRGSDIDMSWSYNYHSTATPITSDGRAAVELFWKAGGPAHFLPDVPNLECSEAYEALALDLVRV